MNDGRKHYDPGKGYHFYAGRDASRAFATGDADPAGLTDDLTGLSDEDLSGIAEWHSFYHKTYIFVGRVVGRSGKHSCWLLIQSTHSAILQ